MVNKIEADLSDGELLDAMDCAQKDLKRSKKSSETDTRYSMMRETMLTKARIAFSCAKAGLFKQQIMAVLDWNVNCNSNCN